MAKIELKSSLVLGTNYKYHLVDFQGTTITINATGNQITATGMDFTASSETAGLVKRAIVVGDLLTVKNTTESANEGMVVRVDTVAALTIDYTVVSGVPVDESAGSDINIQAFDKYFEFLEAGALTFPDGVAAITWVSKVVDDWLNLDYDVYDKMFTAIEPRAKSMAALNGWKALNSDTLLALRDMALEIRNTPAADPNLIYACPRSGALHEATDKFNIWYAADPEMNAPTPAFTDGYINQLVNIYDNTLPDVITGVTAANPAVVTAAAHSLTTGDTIQIYDIVGMTELNGDNKVPGDGVVQVTVIDATSFSLDGIDSTGFGAYVSGGSYAIDRRGTWTFRCLEPGKTHLQEDIDMTFAEIYPVGSSNGIDPKLADPGTGDQFVTDVAVQAGIYVNIDLNVDADSLYDGDVDSVLYTFIGFVDFDTQSNEAGHTKVHYLLRQPTNINADGTGPQIRGDKTPPITSFSGDLLTIDQYYPLNYAAAQRNFLNPVDTSDLTRSWPAIYTLIPTAEQILVGGTFSVIHEDTFGNSNPTYLQNESAVAQQNITVSASNPIVIAYSTYSVDGHGPNTPIPLRVVWNKPGSVEPDNVKVTMTAANQSVPMSATLDPSYVAA